MLSPSLLASLQAIFGVAANPVGRTACCAPSRSVALAARRTGVPTLFAFESEASRLRACPGVLHKAPNLGGSVVLVRSTVLLSFHSMSSP